MRKNIISAILIIGLLLSFSFQGKAVRAYPYPIKTIQPDGSVLTIQIHGDEFLNWTTCGNSLVSKGEDGFYYLASFDHNGYIIKSGVRASAGNIVQSSVSTITPPAAAISRAIEMKSKMRRVSLSGAASQKAADPISIGKKPFLVILIEFSDLEFTLDSPSQAFLNLLNQDGYSANGGTGSVKDYYMDNSLDQFEPDFEIVEPIKVSKSYSYYGANNHDERYVELIVEACRLIDARGFDFSKYDNDGDGVIDNVFFYYAGHNEAEGGGDNTIWPHSWNVSYFQNTYFDGRKLATYACSSEYNGSYGTSMCGIGTFCHEFGHVLGLPDFYDTDYETNGQASGLYNYSLMCYGSYNNNGRTPPYLNAEERKLLGWMGSPDELVASGSYSLEGISGNKAYYFETPTEGEYYLLETRKNIGWDKGLSGFGMIVYHVDKSGTKVHGYTAASRWSNWDGINAYSDHECFDLVPAYSPESNLPSYSYIPFPGKGGKTEFTASTSPASKSWANVKTGFNISNIAFNGETVTFSLINDNTETLFYDLGFNAVNSPKEVYSNGDSFTPQLIISSKVPKSYVFKFDGKVVEEGSPITLSSGEHTVTALLTYEDNTTETITQLLKVQ